MPAHEVGDSVTLRDGRKACRGFPLAVLLRTFPVKRELRRLLARQHWGTSAASTRQILGTARLKARYSLGRFVKERSYTNGAVSNPAGLGQAARLVTRGCARYVCDV